MNNMNDLLTNPFGTSDAFANHTPQSGESNLTETPTSSTFLIDRLSDDHKQQAKALATQINEQDMQSIVNYGYLAQKKLGDFSQNMLKHVQSKDLGEIGDTLTELMNTLNSTNPDDLLAQDSNIFRKLFGTIKKSIYEMSSKYQEIGAQVDKIALRLTNEKNQLLNDNASLEALYTQNKEFFDALTIYIAAGELKLQELETNLIPQAIQKAQESGDQMDVQVVNDLQQFMDRLEKRNHDLKLTRQMTIQQAPQIRLIQNTNQALAEKIQSSVTTAIPLWKNQIAIAMTLLRQKNAITAQRQVSETTNQLISKNSELLKISTIETARENERGIIDLQTLKKTQQDLITTLEETLKIQEEGRQKRQHAEVELGHMEMQLRENLLRLSKKEQAYHHEANE